VPSASSPRPRLNTFDRHVIARMLVATGLLVALLVVFFVVLDYLEHVDDFMDRGATWQQVVFDYYLMYVPEIVRLTSPLAVFLAAIYVTARLAQTLQVVALRSAGVSLARLLRPYVLVGATVAVFMFGFNGWIVPRTQAEVLNFQNRYLKNVPEPTQSGQLFRQNAPGSVLSVGFYDREAARGFRVSLQDLERGPEAVTPTRVRQRLDAQEMTWIDSLEVWQMREVTVRRFDGDLGTRRHVPVLDTALAVLPRDLARTERDADRLTIPEAAAYLQDMRRAGADGLGRPLVSYYSKFSYPLANLLLVLIAVPLAAVRRRGGQAVQLGLGLLVAFCYLALQKLAEPFGYAGAVPPIVVAWLPHLVFFVVALVLLARARR
jgi:lipopolysaccharide export system permease protein